MAVPASTRDVSKAINAFMQSPSLPLPDDVVQVVEGYLEKHERYDEAAADRLNDELVAIYHKSVQGRPDRYAAFLAVLRPLRAAIRSPVRIMQWWDRLVGPILDAVGQQKGLAKEALASSLNLLTFDDGGERADGQPNPVADRVFRLWMDLSQGRQSASTTPQDPFKGNLLREALLMFGKKMPKDFMMLVDIFIVKKEYRATALTLLCQFLSSQPPHLHLVLQTPLFGNLLQCLQHDTSTTVVSIALSALIMFLPNMPSSLVPFLPSLFNIYARLLFWDKEKSVVSDSLAIDAQPQGTSSSGRWERCLYLADLDGPSVPHLSDYFTMLYGLYPINFVDYIRKPQRYLRHANTTENVDVQPTEIRDRSERFRRCHLLHPNFYSLTFETETTDFGRWIKAEPAEVVADCMALCLPSDLGSGHRPSSASHNDAVQPLDGDDNDNSSLLGGSAVKAGAAKDAGSTMQRHSSSATADSTAGSVERQLSGRARENSESSHHSTGPAPETRTSTAAGEDSPTLPPNLGASASQTQLQDMIQSNKLIKSNLHQSLTNDSVPSLALSHQDSIPEKGSIRLPLTLAPESNNNLVLPSAAFHVQLSQLYRQILLLQNDLNFERYMKEQHLAHIGELRSKQVRESATEAETQNLVLANRHLKKRLEDAKKAEVQAKKETDHRRTMATKWESELSGKLRGLRDEQKKWNVEGASLKRELDAAKDKYERLRRLVAEAEDRELKARQQEQLVDTNIEEVERLKAEVKRLSDVEREYQARERSMATARNEAAEVGSRAEKLSIELRVRELELQQTRARYEVQVTQLNEKLEEAVRDTAARRDAEMMHATVQRALEASRAKQAELQKQYSLLTRKNTMLQSSLLDLATNNRRTSDDLSVSDDVDGDAGTSNHSFGSPTSVRSRPHRGFSDPEMLETSYNVTPPLDALSTSLGGVLQRPSTPSGSGGTGPDSALRNSPQQGDRYHGRGGVQNSTRKEKKERKPEAEKKDRKAGGIRGIRGFV